MLIVNSKQTNKKTTTKKQEGQEESLEKKIQVQDKNRHKTYKHTHIDIFRKYTKRPCH